MSTTASLARPVAALLLLLAACSTARRDPGEPGPGPGPGPAADGSVPSGRDGGTPPGTPGTFRCCINRELFECPSEAALDQCIGFDVDGCLAGCRPEDFMCIDGCFRMLDMTSPDPSACTRRTELDGTCGSPSTGSCTADTSGRACDYDDDCDSQNCVDGHCYARTNGSLCDYDDDCDSNNCSEGCCAGNGVGASCDYDDDCDSQNCFEGSCEGRGLGSGCDYDDDCDSNVCTDSVCR